jgi:hypothetical protein
MFWAGSILADYVVLNQQAQFEFATKTLKQNDVFIIAKKHGRVNTHWRTTRLSFAEGAFAT